MFALPSMSRMTSSVSAMALDTFPRRLRSPKVVETVSSSILSLICFVPARSSAHFNLSSRNRSSGHQLRSSFSKPV